ncbi:MAG: TolC family protein [Desulfobulbaceae bacterium]|nr:TolC family protein [Desulfobulbaceae bacterium]
MRIQRFAECTIVFFLLIGCSALPPAQATEVLPSSIPDKVTLEEALDMASRNRLELTSFQTDVDAAEIRLKYAGLPPNPEIGVEWNNLGNDLPDGDTKETIISLTQSLEIGGKPSARKNKSQAEILRLQREQVLARLDIATEVKKTFLEVLSARERLALQHEAGKIADELVKITHEQVVAGKLAATEETRAEARKAETMAELQKLNRLLAEAELNLATVIAEPNGVTMTVEGRLAYEVAIPDRQTLLAGIKDSPLLTLRRSETQLAATNLSLEQANVWSDPTVSLAVREVPDEDARAVAIGFSIPLPLFQRNQTALAEAEATAHKAAKKEQAAARSLQTELIKAHTILVAADQEARMLQTDGLSRAKEAAEAVQEGFRVGKYRYSDVLEASQFLITMKGRYLDAILDMNHAAIALDRLLGKPEFPAASNKLSSSSSPRSNP